MMFLDLCSLSDLEDRRYRQMGTKKRQKMFMSNTSHAYWKLGSREIGAMIFDC